ncbi:MAG: arsenate reductase ArsC [Deltaproteobacteria bacterium]|nr:arsenate reductase ArsC [Candidatus Anaeroferrophillacea bacterium]
MTDKRVLFICSHNSARSQMAAALLKKIGGDDFMVASAGLEPGPLNPLAVEVMGEIGLDISGNKPQSVFELFKQGKLYTHVITVCDQAATSCPVFPGLTQRLHWPFANPAEFKGTWEEKLARTREVRDAIRERIIHWLEELKRER